MRRKTPENIYRDYVEGISGLVGGEQRTNNSFDVETKKPLSRSAFRQIFERFTRGQLNRKAAVDYILGTLVYDNVRVLGDIVSFEIIDVDDAKRLLSQLDAVEEFLKFTMLEHIGADSDPFHDPEFALGDSFSLPQVQNVTSKCVTCMSPFQVVENIRGKIQPGREKNIFGVLNDSAEKILLYMGHQHRCHNQEKRISQLFGKLRPDKSLSKVILLLDYKMKFEPICYREKTTEFFGKKGISWHGAENLEERQNHCSSQSREACTTIETLFFDHVSSNDMTQDSVAVESVLDAIFARVCIELPTVSSIRILSDNARCYQNDLLPVVAPFIAKAHGLVLSGIVNSETQRGKSLLDTHFAIAMMHVSRYCSETRKDATTPGDIVLALNGFGGVANCTAEMVHISRGHEELVKLVEAKRGKKSFPLGRVNEVTYSEWNADEINARCYKLSGREYNSYTFRKYRSMDSSAACIQDHMDVDGDDDGVKVPPNASDEDLPEFEIHEIMNH